MPKFTDMLLRRLKPGDARRALTEPGGLALRVSPGGAKVFYARYQLDGKPHWMRLGEYGSAYGLARAREDAARVIREAREARQGKGLNPAAVRRAEKAAAKVERLKNPTVTAFADVYLERYAKRHKATWKEDERILAADVLPLVGELKLAELRRAHVIAVLDRKVDAGRPKQAGEVLKIVRRMLNFAVERGELEHSPAALVKAPAKYTPRSRVLSGEEIAGLFRVLPGCGMHQGMKLAIELQLLTAQRPGAVRAARWSEIDRKARTWVIPASRMKRARRQASAEAAHLVPLSAEACVVLERAAELAGRSPHVFPGRDESKPWSPEAIDHEIHREGTLAKFKAEGVARWNLHDLRRTATTLMSELGIAPHIKDRVLGHLPQDVTGRHYDLHDYEREKREALEALATRIEEVKTRKRADVVPLSARSKARRRRGDDRRQSGRAG